MSPPASRANGLLVDTIYCEAKCSDEDVYYFGSDDDQYESPGQRKRRYERAGQRFLEGSAPRLFSASLRGPFESSDGWKNPWASRTSRTHANRTAQRLPPKLSQSTKQHIPTKPTNRHVRIQTKQPNIDKPECHLPSPQSLKTVSLISDAHPFLEDDELRAVQAWRHGVRSTEPGTDLQSRSATAGSASSQKRKASHNWLKTVPDKRSRTENSPARLEACTPTLPTTIHGGEGHATTTNASRWQSSSRLLPTEAITQLISPPKQPLATNTTPKRPVQSNDEPVSSFTRDQQAAATLSSPVSLRNIKQEKATAQPSPLKLKTKIHSISNVSERSDANARNTTAIRHRAADNIVRTPHRVSDDEHFIFDIALDPLSDSSENESEEESGNGQAEFSQETSVPTKLGTGDHHQPTVQEEVVPEEDGSSDSDLTELSETPALSVLEESADESDAECEEVLDATKDISDEIMLTTEPRATGIEVTSEAMDANEDVQVAQLDEVQDISASEEMSTIEVAPETQFEDRSVGNVDVDTAMFYQAEEHTATSDSNDLRSAPDTDVGQLSQQILVAADDTQGSLVEAECAESESRVIATLSVRPEAAPAVPPSPKIKQEASEFSLKAMFRNLVPTSTWTQLAGLTSASEQSATHQPVVNTMEEHVLPSIEVALEQDGGATTSIDGCSEAEESTAVSDVGELSSEADESGQQLLSEADEALASNNLPTPIQATDDGAAHASREGLSEVEQNEMTAEDEPTAVNEAAITSMLPEQEVSTSQPPAAKASTTSTEMPPPEVPENPVRLLTPSPADKGINSEPRFAFKSFAAFTTPSPERLRVKKRRTLPSSCLRDPGVKGILSSRKAGSVPRTHNRVSWLLSGEQEADAAGSNSDKSSSPATPLSPPPRTPLAELPTAANEKFAKHFSSVVKRTDGLRHRFHVPRDTDRMVEGLGSSQCTSSQSSNIVARSNADITMKDAPLVESGDVENQSRPREATMSVEPMDMVEDMVREMGDFWQAWDVDAELNAAKKAQPDTAVTGLQAQNSWR
ncbi:hypothetical protein PWT90_08525 [Aphanocladium album]|nr:hypothetical protein PWT90_08525 [Aphanocladium album]